MRARKKPQFRHGGMVVTIDRKFVNREVRDAVRQFFLPLTAPFFLEVPARTRLTRAPKRRQDEHA